MEDSPELPIFAAMERKVRVRFAPSPTGPLHIGGVRTALYNYLFARKHGGDFILRIEDTDQNRFVPGAEDYIIESLKWIGITPNEGLGFGDGKHAPYRQSERKSMYRQYAEQLINSGHAYYAFDTPEELEAMREKLKASNMNSQYDAASRQYMKNSLTLPQDEVQRRLEGGEHYVIRIKLPRKEEVRFHDEIRGWVVVSTTQLDDKVLFKSDGMPTYHLANVVDDYLMEVTHVIRGEEWLPSAPLHVLLYQYLGWESVMPKFAHLPLLLKPEGNGKLSKRDGDRLGFPVFPLEWKDPVTNEVSSGYRESGYFPDAVLNMLALLGWHPADNREMFTKEELVNEFSIERVSKSGAKFDVEKAKWFNHQYLLHKTDEELADYLSPIATKSGIKTEAAYLRQVIALMKEKVNFLPQILTEGKYFFEDPAVFDDALLAKKWSASTLPLLSEIHQLFIACEGFTKEQLEKIFHDVLEKNGKKPGEIMPVLRMAITGAGGGAPLFDVFALLGKETVLRRFGTFLERYKNYQATA